VAYSPHLFPVSQLSLPLPAANPQMNSPSLCQTQQNILSSYKSTNEFTITMPDTTKYLIFLQIQRLHSKLEACPRNSRCMIDAD
jgi:hypothetical protein